MVIDVVWFQMDFWERENAHIKTPLIFLLPF